MSMAIAGTVLAVGGTAYAANQAGNAADAQVGAARDATAVSDRQYNQTRTDLAPYRVTGTGALNQLGRLFGLPTTTPEDFALKQDRQVGNAMLPGDTRLVSTDGGKNRYYDVFLDDQRIGALTPGGPSGRFTNDTGIDIEQLKRQRLQSQQSSAPAQAGPDMSAFFQSPGYQFRRDEGMRDIGNSFGAGGGAFSGNALKALAEWNGQNASQEFGNYVNQLGTIAGIGQSSTNQTAAYGANAANQAGRNSLYAGDARASGIENQANFIGEGINQLGTMAGYYSKKPKNTSGVGYYDIDLGGYPRRM
jgi:hypothetical protein